MPGHEAQRQSFSLANIAPQNSELNRGPWADLENRMRDYVQDHGELWVVTGVLFEGERINTTPDGRIMVPTSFWKAVAVPGKGVLVFVAPNDASGTIDQLSPEDFTQRTGITPSPHGAGRDFGDELMDGFKAFGEAQSLSLGDLTVESDEDNLALYGRMALTIDQPSLERLDHLIAALTQARADLAKAMGKAAARRLPTDLPSVRNPFA
jgi:hypothetical protein